MGTRAIDIAIFGTLYSFASFLFFYALNWLLTSKCIPSHLRGDSNKEWRWCNYGVSFVHSTLSGSLALLCVLLTPELLEEVILRGYSEAAYIAICFSYGYFWYDTVDLIKNLDKDYGNRTLILHHIFALTSASWVVFSRTFVGFGLCSLLIELHSSTLHLRVLLKLYTKSRETTAYGLLKVFNMATFFSFRFGSLFYLVYALIRDRGVAYRAGYLSIYIFMFFALGVIIFLSCQLFVKVFNSDFAAKRTEPLKGKEELLDVPDVQPISTTGSTEKIAH